MVNRVGQIFDKYRLTVRIGSGAFGEVYLAEKVVGTGILASLPVAVKLLNMQLTQEGLRSFLNEASKFCLEHPNIVRIRGFGLKDDTPFIVMEYAPNGTLRQRHPWGSQVPPVVVVTYVNQIAAALQYIHDEGLIHRDVKPDNMLIGKNNEILLSDFGITVISPSLNIPLQPEGIAGTPNYMAPEQFLGQPSRASDQYALAVITYEWLSGYCPFQGSFFELKGQQLQFSPPLLHHKIPTLTSSLAQVVQKALAKDPNQRFESVKEFASALEQASKIEVAPIPQTLSKNRSYLLLSKKPEQWRAEGNAYRNARKYKEAIEVYNFAIELNPNFTGCYYDRGLTYYYLKEYDLAIADYNQALSLNPKYALVYHRRGLVYEELNKYVSAIADYDQAIMLAPEFVQAYNNRGLCYSLLGDYKRAIENFNKVVKLEVKHAMAYYHCGIAHYNLNEYEQAVQKFDLALQINPDLALASIARQAAKRLLKN